MRIGTTPPSALVSCGSGLSLLLVLGSVMCAPAAPGQTKTSLPSEVAPPQSNSVPKLEKDVSEVSLDLVVRDKKGRPVPDLAATDLLVTEDGTPVKLSHLKLATPGRDSPRLITLVFDDLDGAMGKNARTLAGRILKAIPADTFAISVVYVNGRLRLLQPYTTDRTLVDRAVLSATGAPGTNAATASAAAEETLLANAGHPQSATDQAGLSLTSAADREAAKAMVAAIKESQQLAGEQAFLDHREVTGFVALTALAHAGEKWPGRKIALYFSAGVTADTRAIDLVKTTVGAANRAEMSIYPVDLSTLGTSANDDMVVSLVMGSVRTGLALNPPPVATRFSPGDTTPAGIRTAASDNIKNLELGDGEGISNPLGRLAHGTAGRYIPAQMNLSKQIRLLVDDATSFYVATYSPPKDEYDGSFREVAVKSLRKDVSIRSRSGYFALPHQGLAGLQPFEYPLLRLLKQPQPPADFRFFSRTVQLGKLATGLTQELAVELPISQLEAKRDASSGLYTVQATALAQVLDASGEVVEQFSQELRRRGALETLDSARTEALSFQRTFNAPPGKYTVRVAIMDTIGQKASVMQSDLLLTEPGLAPFLSDLVLVRHLANERISVPEKGSLPAAAQSAAAEVVPNLAATIPAGTKEVSLFFVIHPGPPALGKAAVQITVSRNGHMIGHAPLTFRETPANDSAPYFSTLGTRSMSPGEYTVTVRLDQGGQSFERSQSLKIEAGSKAGETATNRSFSSASGNPSTDDANPADDASAALPPLAITPAGPEVGSKSPAEVALEIEQARKRALDYAATLPNFLCVETTNRSSDSSGKGQWKRHDSFSEVLTYRDRSESRRVVEVNGHASHSEPDSTKNMVSHGEFGGILNAIFDPSAHAAFVWKQSGLVAGEHVDIFEYQVAAKNSSFGLTGDNNWQLNTAFHGVVAIDSTTLGVRQLTIVADDLPKDFSIHASAMRVDYDYIAINGHDYLLPMRATIALRRHKHESILNEIQFRDYRRFGTKSRMLAVIQ